MLNNVVGFFYQLLSSFFNALADCSKVPNTAKLLKEKRKKRFSQINFKKFK